MHHYLVTNKRFLIQVASLSFLIIMLVIAGSYTTDTYKKPYSRIDSLIDRVKSENELLLADTSFLIEYPEYIFDLPEITVRFNPTILIQSRGTSNKIQLAKFLLTHNPKLAQSFVNQVIDSYLSNCALEGINHDIAISQMCLETGFLKFKGSVKANQFNFCGLGAVGNNNSGSSFASIEEGIRAHIQHLKAYASNDPLKTELVDSRFIYVKRGIAPDVYSLSGTWAADIDYGRKLESLIQMLSRSGASTEDVLASNI